MTYHKLQAYIDKVHGPSFRVICTNLRACQTMEGNNIGCRYMRTPVSKIVDMIGWPEDLEHVIGELDLRPVVSEDIPYSPDYYKKLREVSEHVRTDIENYAETPLEDTQRWTPEDREEALRHGDETDLPAET